MGVVNVYNNANKIFNLHKALPIGAITWGAGNIGSASISTLAKDLRRRFSGEDPAHADWKLDRRSYSILEVAERLRTFMYDEQYVKAFADWEQKPHLGFMVTGYSADETMAEEYRVEMTDGGSPPPVLQRKREETGLSWSGEPEAVGRLIMGFSPALPAVLESQLGVPREQMGAVMTVLQGQLAAPLIQAAMPLQDAIDVARFLVDLATNWSRFFPGAPTVGGPVEIAAISKHEGFKWVARKHYFEGSLNPPWAPTVPENHPGDTDE